MAFLSAQSDKSAIRSISVQAEGKIAEYLDSLTTFAAVGSLSVSGGEDVNYVNAKFWAEEKGITFDTAEISHNSGYNNKVTVKITTEKGVNTISGTVFNDNMQRIVDINHFALDIEPKGNMIFLRNSDVPGVIGEVGKVLGNEGINIADFRLSRGKNGALAVILVDATINSDILSKLANLEAAISVSYAEI